MTKSKNQVKERKPNWQETYATVEDIKDFLADRLFLRPTENEKGEFMPVSRAMQVIGGYLSMHINISRLGQAFMTQGDR